MNSRPSEVPTLGASARCSICFWRKRLFGYPNAKGFLSGDPIGARVRNLADEELSAEEIADQLSVFLTTVERYW